MLEPIIKGYNLSGIKALIAALKKYHDQNLVFEKVAKVGDVHFTLAGPAGLVIDDLITFLNFEKPNDWFAEQCTMEHWKGSGRFGGVNTILKEKVLVYFNEEGINIDFLCN